MAAAMVIPVIPFLCLVWFGVTESAQCGGYCALSVAAMLTLMFLPPKRVRGSRDVERASDGQGYARKCGNRSGEASTSMRFLYLYVMKEAPDRVRSVAPEHVTYWQGLKLPDYLGGPFADRSGGLITFETDSVSEAERLVGNDPFLRADLLERFWAKEWMIEPTPS